MSRFVFLITCICLLVCLLVGSGLAQSNKKLRFFCTYGESNRGAELCEYIQERPFASNQHAERAVDNILNPLGLKRNFILVSCPRIKNAMAVTLDFDGIRYIFYDNAFMEEIDRNSNTNWASVSILAHEIGHHLSGHTTLKSHNPPTREDLQKQREWELEADEFSGFALFKLGATLQQSQAAINASPDVLNEETSTHPKRWRRLESIKKGYENAKSQQSLRTVNRRESAEEYYHFGILHHAIAISGKKRESFYKAIENYTGAINLNPNFSKAYYFRGLAKLQLGDKMGACNDLHKACVLGDIKACFDYDRQCNH